MPPVFDPANLYSETAPAKMNTDVAGDLKLPALGRSPHCAPCRSTVQRVRAFAPYTACFKCCKKLNAGNYHADFLFLRIPFPPAVR